MKLIESFCFAIISNADIGLPFFKIHTIQADILQNKYLLQQSRQSGERT